MVCVQQNKVFFGGDAHERRAVERPPAQIEGCSRKALRVGAGVQTPPRQIDPFVSCQVVALQRQVSSRRHDLIELAVFLFESRPQRLVPVDENRERRAQSFWVDAAAHLYGKRTVVDRRSRSRPHREPQTLLAVRGQNRQCTLRLFRKQSSQERTPRHRLGCRCSSRQAEPSARADEAVPARARTCRIHLRESGSTCGTSPCQSR